MKQDRMWERVFIWYSEISWFSLTRVLWVRTSHFSFTISLCNIICGRPDISHLKTVFNNIWIIGNLLFVTWVQSLKIYQTIFVEIFNNLCDKALLFLIISITLMLHILENYWQDLFLSMLVLIISCVEEPLVDSL